MTPQPEYLERRTHGLLLALAILCLAGAGVMMATDISHYKDWGPAEPGVRTELVACYDGDTCTFSQWETPVRLARIDTPELAGSCPAAARAARDALLAYLSSAEKLRVDSLRTGHYGRIVAEVYADGANVSDWLLDTGLAVTYGAETCTDRGMP